ncbi:MAG: AAA family ATPase [Oscillospiraceae bacterium]
MNKIEQVRITGMTISGFKSYEGPTELTFGDPTVITGGNGRGKTSIADAIAFAVTGLPFFGERGIDRLHNESNPDVSIQMRFVDERGAAHELTRTRRKNRMTITYDGYEIRQLDLTDLLVSGMCFSPFSTPCTSSRSWVRTARTCWSGICRISRRKRSLHSFPSRCGKP